MEWWDKSIAHGAVAGRQETMGTEGKDETSIVASFKKICFSRRLYDKLRVKTHDEIYFVDTPVAQPLEIWALRMRNYFLCG